MSYTKVTAPDLVVISWPPLINPIISFNILLNVSSVNSSLQILKTSPQEDSLVNLTLKSFSSDSLNPEVLLDFPELDNP